MATKKAREIIEHANGLGKIREAMSTPRSELARALGVSGAAFAKTDASWFETVGGQRFWQGIRLHDGA